MKQKVGDLPVTKGDLLLLETKLSKRIGGITEKVGGLSDKTDSLSVKTDSLTMRMDSLSDKTDSLTARMDSFEKRMDKLDKKIDDTEKILRTEIKLSAEETKEELKKYFTESVSRLMETIDVFMVEIRASRDEREVTAHQLARCSDRLDIIEQKLHVVI